MNTVGYGIIYDIEASKFFSEGSIYINEDLTETSEEKEMQIIDLVSKRLSNFSFDKKIQSILEETEKDEVEKLNEERSLEIKDFFKKNKGRTLDIIFFPDSGIRGTQKVILEENSILYIPLAFNIKLGFFINKTLAYILFKEGGAK